MTSPEYDILVIGAGHAGVEAALAASRMGKKTALLTLDTQNIAQMSCNPAIGGLAKGHLVRELDVLGGEMGLAVDNSGLQFKMLNRSKGRAVWSPRAQADKHKYRKYFIALLSKIDNLTVITANIRKLSLENGIVRGVETLQGSQISGKRTVLCNGTFLNGIIHIGDHRIASGRYGELPSHGITEQLRAEGMTSARLKTGTPPRVHRDSIDFSKMQIQHGDTDPEAFSFRTPRPFRPLNIPCYLCHTNTRSHEIISSALHRSPLYSGKISGTGPRYCPSIEDKVVRFAEKISHQLFLEPEWKDSPQWYVNGFSSSLPLDIQLKALRLVPGLEKAQFIRPAYAIEYDHFPSWQLKISLESRAFRHLYLAGQINGTSGYEEAAVQGFMAAVNAVRSLQDKEPLVMGRHESYIGVLINDLITKETKEPYRMFTSLAEYRLLLRYDNPHHRLLSRSKELGILPPSVIESFTKSRDNSRKLYELFQKTRVFFPENNRNSKYSIDQLIKQKKILDKDLSGLQERHFPLYKTGDLMQAFILSTYDGYIKRQEQLIDKTRKLDNLKIPRALDYSQIPSLSNEGREKLLLFKPETLGSASRIRGVSPTDLQILLMYIKQVSRET